MHFCLDKDINRLVSNMIKEGWRYEVGRHGKLRPPSGAGFITIPKTPSDFRSLQNIRRDIRRLQKTIDAKKWC